MNQTITFNLKCIIFTILGTTILFSNTVSAQLKGSYTIDGTASASSTNYKTFASAISDMVSGSRADGGTANGKGVAGAVVFKVANGTYKEQVTIPKISGASATNTIKFQSGSGDSSKVVLTSASSTSATANYTLELNTARYITFQQITISRTGANAYGIAVALTGGTAYNQFIGNLFIGIVDPSTSTLSIIAGNAVLNSTGNDSNCLFMGNRFKNGYNSMAFTGTQFGYNNTITNNICDTAGMAGVYATNYQTNMLISGNIFNMGPFTNFTGHYVSYGVRLENAINYKVLKNKFYATSGASVSRCIVLFFGTVTTGNRNLLANNFAWVSAGSTSSTGITLGGNASLDVLYNNVLMTSVPSTSAALYVYPQYAGSSNVIMNNNLINKGSGTAIDNSNDPSTSGYSTGMARSNYNNLYTKGTYIGIYQTSSYTTLAKWQATTYDSNSVNVDPGYVSNVDMHVSSSAINNKGIAVAAVTDDIDGEKRSNSTPDIGADEFTPTTVDAGITSLDSPSVFCAPKTSSVIVKFTNFGLNTLTSVKINWSVNGTLQTAYSWTGSLATGNISSGVSIGTFAFSAKTPYVVKVWTSAPNGSTDQKNTNDTLLKSMASGLSGNYTIGGSSPDFKTFNEALDAITLRGLCGATVMNVRNGTYVEQISVPNYPSLSATSTLTFQSEKADSSKVILTLASVNANGVNNVVLQLNGCRYVTFRQMTMLRTGPGSFQGVIEIKGKAHHNSFLNNQIIGIKLAATNASADVISSAADQDTANVIKNNLIRYGNMAININGDFTNHEIGNFIEGNTIDSCLASGINVAFNDGIVVRANKLTNACYGNAAYSGILVNNCNNAIRVSSNKVLMPYGGNVGIFVINSNAKSGAEGHVANNFISIGKGSVAPFGIVDSSSSYQNIYYNSVDIYNTSTGVCFYANANGNVNLINNILYNNGGGYAIVIPNTSTIGVSDYNDLATTSAFLGYWNGTTVSDISSWQSTSSQDANSISNNPFFASNTDYHTKNPYLHAKGTPISNITKDIEGNTRSTVKPCIGALEFKTVANDAGIPSLNMASALCEGTSNVLVFIKNTGSADLVTATINWSIDGVLQTAYSFTGKVSPDSSRSVKIGTFKFTAGTPLVKIWSSSPNGKTDSFAFNDTLITAVSVSPQPAAIVGAASTICSNKTVTIGGTAVGGNKYSWTSKPSGFVSSKSNPGVNPAVTTWYILTESNPAGCTKTDSVLITVLPAPKATVGTAFTICANDSFKPGAAAVTGNTYSWKSNPAGYTSALANPTITATTTAYYVLTVTNTNTCVAKDSVKVTVNPAPNASVVKPVTICDGNTVKIGAAAVGSNTYSWTSNPSGFTSTASNPSVTPAATTVYTLTEKITATGCTNTHSTTVNVVTQPTAGPITGPTTVCAGQTVIYAPQNITNGFDYTYRPTITTGTTYTQSGDSLTVHWGASGVGTLWMIAKVSTGTCKDSTKISVNINPVPKAKFTVNEVCLGGTTSFTNASTNAIHSLWVFGDGDSSAADNITHKYKTAGTFNAKLLVVNPSGCYDSFFVNVKVDSLPKPAFKLPAAKCIGTPLTFTDATPGSVKTYAWDFGDGGTDNTPSPTHTYAKTGSFKVILTITNTAGCTDTVSHSLVVSPLPIATFTAHHGHGYVYNFRASDTIQTKYVWDFGDTTAGILGFAPTHTFNGTGIYHVKLSVQNAGGCVSTHDTLLATSNNVGISQDMQNPFNLEVYPNPFTEKTIVSYTLQKGAIVELQLTDITGKQIGQVTNAMQPAGSYAYRIDAHTYNLQPGIYFVNIKTDGMATTRRIVKLE